MNAEVRRLMVLAKGGIRDMDVCVRVRACTHMHLDVCMYVHGVCSCVYLSTWV